VNELTAARFEDYSLRVASKFRNRETLLRNRLKLFRRAYRPLLPALAGARRVLDWGCGSGDLLVFLAGATGAEIVGFDPSRSQLACARERCRDLARVHCASDPAKVQGPFDLVFTSHVVEHVPDEELLTFFRALFDRLAPGGKLVVATPNGLNPLAYAFYMASDATHVRMHSPFTLNELASSFGYEVTAAHRETPQSYDLLSFAKTIVWWLSSKLLALLVLGTAGGVRGLRFPLLMAPTFYCVIERAGEARAGEDAG
jgi:2-polyprenyl-3-methyl-5-hydroxy-6-metoxy-1,4-benzoquinol methylase